MFGRSCLSWLCCLWFIETFWFQKSIAWCNCFLLVFPEKWLGGHCRCWKWLGSSTTSTCFSNGYINFCGCRSYFLDTATKWVSRYSGAVTDSWNTTPLSWKKGMAKAARACFTHSKRWLFCRLIWKNHKQITIFLKLSGVRTCSLLACMYCHALTLSWPGGEKNLEMNVSSKSIRDFFLISGRVLFSFDKACTKEVFLSHILGFLCWDLQQKSPDLLLKMLCSKWGFG